MSYPLEIDIVRQAGDWPPALDALAERAIAAAIKGSGIAPVGPVEVSVLLTDDASQQALNARWRNKDQPTNVLSFPQREPGDPVTGLIGDLSLAHETLEREASGLGKSFEAHFVHLVVHGMLHLLDFDHQTRAEALAMEARETDIMAQLGYDDPYGGDEPEEDR
mgnify:CR=1 FL=1